MITSTILLCSLLVIAASYGSPIQHRSDEHNIYQCIDPTSEKTLLFTQPIYERGGFLQVKTRKIIFPTSGINLSKITCISIQDRDSNGKGAYAIIQSGGLGAYIIEILLKSQLSEGINFNIELYTDA